MYPFLLELHSALRWLVLLGFVVPLARSYAVLLHPRPFTQFDRASIAIGVTAAHAQLLIGCALYFWSPLVSLFWSKPDAANLELLFFGAIHVTGMTAAVVLITVGSSLARRAEEDRPKFRAIAIWWTVAAVMILLTIPWPFSPLAQRPLWRP